MHVASMHAAAFYIILFAIYTAGEILRTQGFCAVAKAIVKGPNGDTLCEESNFELFKYATVRTRLRLLRFAACLKAKTASVAMLRAMIPQECHQYVVAISECEWDECVMY